MDMHLLAMLLPRVRVIIDVGDGRCPPVPVVRGDEVVRFLSLRPLENGHVQRGVVWLLLGGRPERLYQWA